MILPAADVDWPTHQRKVKSPVVVLRRRGELVAFSVKRYSCELTRRKLLLIFTVLVELVYLVPLILGSKLLLAKPNKTQSY